MIYEYRELSESTPELGVPLKRFSLIAENIDDMPRVAVLGKFNHGKSSLLNALMDEDLFSVADQRETREITDFVRDNIRWVDAPGLGADLEGMDDKKAHQAATEQADILMLVHAINTGELDREECQLFNQALRQDYNLAAKVVVVLTRVDQLSTSDLSTSISAIKQQLPDVRIFETSAIRYAKGNEMDKQVLVDKSGIPDLRSYLKEMSEGVFSLRIREAQRLIRKMRSEALSQREHYEKEKTTSEYELSHLDSQLQKNLDHIVEKFELD